jgi:hypothetical protein
VLGNIFVPKRDEVIGKWRRLRNETLYDLHSTPNVCSGDQIKKNETVGACGTYRETGEVYTGFWWGDLMEKE